ncbi:hypothetical protein [Delftia acidovorans]|uniref:hypothetical protein n=1 Tax=Delftia acidovorans TaxID=80866 RepID=UPI0030174B1B
MLQAEIQASVPSRRKLGVEHDKKLIAHNDRPNIENFNRVVLVTLGRLHDAFLVPIELKTAEIADAATPGTLPPQPSFKELEPIIEAVKLLAAEGFLQYSVHWTEGTAFLHAQLTMKVLMTLGKTPNSLENKPGLAAQINTALKVGALNATIDPAKQLVALRSTAATAVGPVIKATAQS